MPSLQHCDAAAHALAMAFDFAGADDPLEVRAQVLLCAQLLRAALGEGFAFSRPDKLI
jgi:hypothetical protein